MQCETTVLFVRFVRQDTRYTIVEGFIGEGRRFAFIDTIKFLTDYFWNEVILAT